MNVRGGAVLVARILSAAGCRSSSAEAGGAPASLPEGALAQVNGVAITEADVGMVTSTRGSIWWSAGRRRA